MTRRKVTIENLRSLDLGRGVTGILGVALVLDKGSVYELSFSKLAGEKIWYVDQMVQDGEVLFSHRPGSRSVSNRYALSGYVEKAVASHMSEVIES